MASLLAAGKGPQDRWEHALPAKPVTLGRLETHSEWATPWDQSVSRRHATLTWLEGKLRVCKHPDARNPIIFQGQPVEEFSAALGESFVIGGTTFEVRDDRTLMPDLPTPHTEMIFNSQELHQIKFSDADERIGVLAALPGMIRNGPSDEALETEVVDALLRGIPRAEVAAVILLETDDATGGSSIRLRCSKGRGRDSVKQFQPSHRLVVDAVQRRRQGVVHLWQPGELRPDFTPNLSFDWAICAPLPDDPSPGLALYLVGRLDSSLSQFDGKVQKELLKGDMKFAGLVADIFGALRQVLDLQRREAKLAIFLPQAVRAALAKQQGDDALAPRETDVTVLFCDLRGSCQIADQSHEDLAGLWDRISEALGIMTSAIIDQGGVIGDFQGDAAMGFWGWPFADGDQVERAARAALVIRKRFAQEARKGKALAGFNCGIGIATGRAFAGRLGTFDQAKVSVYGPKVNLAARLESMTKTFRTSILVDEETARHLLAGHHDSWVRCRRLARVQPYGMRTVLTVSELLPASVEPGSLQERDRRDYEAALDAFNASRWEDAIALLQRLPKDEAAGFLRSFMEQHDHNPPTGWDGVIALRDK
jgi:adenylate cyclase